MLIEEAVIKGLTSLADVPVVAEVPENRPKRFVTVELTANRELEQTVAFATVALQAWAENRFKAAMLIDQVANWANELPNRFDFIVSTNVNTYYNWPDPASKQARYQLVCEIIYYKNGGQ